MEKFERKKIDKPKPEKKHEVKHEVKQEARQELQVKKSPEKKSEIAEGLDKSKECFQGALKNMYGLSCYIDSVLMILFTVLHKFTEKYIEKPNFKRNDVCSNNPQDDYKIRENIRKEFINLFNQVKGLKSDQITCVNFSRLTEECQNPVFERFNISPSGNMRDASEFLSFISTVFELDRLLKYTETKTISKLSGKTEVVTDVIETNPIWVIYPDQINKFDNTEDMLSYDTLIVPDSGDTLTITEKKEIKHTVDILFIDIRRLSLKSGASMYDLNNPNNTVFNTKIIYPTDIIDINNQRLVLVACVVFNNRHYTSFLRCNDKWYHYDDTMSPKINLYASDWDEFVTKNSYFVPKQTTMFVYADTSYFSEWN